MSQQRAGSLPAPSMTKPPFDRERLLDEWQPLDWTASTLLRGEATRYAAYYGIDFARQLDGVQHSFGYVDSAGFRIACHLLRATGQSRGTLLVGHGYFDHAGLYRHPIGFFLRRGFNVVAFDLPGHGLSSGRPASIDSFSHYQAALKSVLDGMAEARLTAPWHWLAQSTGGAIAMDYLLHTPAEQQPFDKVWLLAPLVWPRGWNKGKYLHALLSPFITSIKRHFAHNSHDDDFLQFLKHEDPLQSRRLPLDWISAWKRWLPGYLASPPCEHSISVIQGEEDGTVDWQRNLPEIKAHFPQASIHRLANARHQLVNESEAYRQQIEGIIGDSLST